MHVVMISDAETSGGAAIAASRLAEALVQLGIRVTRIVNHTDGQEYPWTTQVLRVRLREEIALKVLKKFCIRLGMYTLKWLISQRLHHFLMKLRPNVINVHNLHGAGWPPDLLAVCAHHAPTVWTLHDMWSFTGHCAYSYECEKFISGCDCKCPIPNDYPALAPNRIECSWQRRKKLFSNYPSLIAVCPSRWLAREAKRGFWKSHRVEVIPHGVNLEVYKPVEKFLARNALGIEASAPVVLTAAQNLNDRRKGGAILIEALQKVRIRPFILITLGHGSISIATDGITLHSLGYIDHERTKVLVYNAADLLVHPAIADNLPNIVMEAIACGTPVVSFAIGGTQELVRPNQTGWLANEVSSEALASTIDTALTDLHNGVNLRASCRNVAKAEYSSHLQAQRYLDLFKSL